MGKVMIKPHGMYGTLTYKLMYGSEGRLIVVVLRKNRDVWFVRDIRIIEKKYFGLVTYTYKRGAV